PPGSSPEPMRVPGSRRSPPVTRSTLGNPRPGRSSPSTSITGRTGRRRHDAENRWPDPVAWKSTATTEHPSRPHPRRATEEVKALHRILSTQLQAHTGRTVRLAGWVHRRRLLKSVAFLILRDRTGLAQIVVAQGKQLPPEETVIEVTESGANVFALDYFGRPAYLAQSPQFYKQMMVGVFERVYEVGPAFRAEPHDTGRHLAQYTSLDAELGFITDHRDVMTVVREAVAAMSTVDVLEEIPAIHFADALALMGADPGEPDLAPAHERWLGEWVRREHGSEFLFVT